ncbi:DNA ligase (NAD(+)) LigA [Putridiphycobacter roseus]|uniref:DNA ligase n=1 Tax=Putridiphycobacter roseus TaxID=2219161 RepID=A0A2W1N534_9FLAO|nr:NAD-dependent DNA ligase LigA [Putridiphycobacter roseus]PZE18221.1 DNA ligase (NAD(+)) LigA [Putridiphycobacter roseus]
MNIKEKIEHLEAELERFNHAYYINNQSLVSDLEYDLLLKKLESLEKEHPDLASPNSPTKRVGGDITKQFDTIKHKLPMLSLANTYSKEELTEWETRIKKIIEHDVEYICELKYDGVAIGIQYVNGELYRAVTRGDGTQGEDVTKNVRTIKSIPLKLKGDYPQDFEIRGEIFMPLKNFKALNQKREAAGEELYANPRNTASGTLKSLNSKVVAQRGLDCFLYGVYGTDLFESHYQSILKTKDWGFNSPSPEKNYIKKVNSIDEIMEFIQYWNSERNNLPFEIDGIVLKVNNYDTQKILGYTAKNPRWAISYKFKAERAESILQEVTYQVGRTGAITPVANLKPVLLAGTTVKRASLHNADQIAKLDLHINDQVYVEKGGEIIPKIVGVNLAYRKNNTTTPIQFIQTCPDCGTPLTRNEGEAQHYCPNDIGCPTQILGKIEHFISRKAMNIDGIGPETIVLFHQKGLINNVADLYTLTFEDIIDLDRVADKSANNIIKGINLSKTKEFEKVLFALGIRYVGETVAKKLAKYFKNIDRLMQATFEELIVVDEIGERIAQSVIAYFQNPKHIDLIQQLQKQGLQFNVIENLNETSKLEGQTFIISGVFETHSREELKHLIEENGGKNTSSISKKTNYLIAGDKMGPSKLEKANKLGVKIISETEFIQMLA